MPQAPLPAPPQWQRGSMPQNGCLRRAAIGPPHPLDFWPYHAHSWNTQPRPVNSQQRRTASIGIPVKRKRGRECRARSSMRFAWLSLSLQRAKLSQLGWVIWVRSRRGAFPWLFNLWQIKTQANLRQFRDKGLLRRQKHHIKHARLNARQMERF